MEMAVDASGNEAFFGVRGAALGALGGSKSMLSSESVM